MFIKWKRRKEASGEYMLYAALVEAKRIDGKSRQVYIAYIGGISEKSVVTKDQLHLVLFWQSARSVINQLKRERDLSIEQLRTLDHIEPMIERKIGKPKERLYRGKVVFA